MMQPFDNLRAINERRQSQEIEARKHTDTQTSLIDIQETVVKSFAALVDYLDSKTTKTEVVNQLRQIGTPDALKVVTSVENLHETIRNKPEVDLSEIVSLLRESLEQVKLIPKEQVELPEAPEQTDYTDSFKRLEDTIESVKSAIEAQKTTVEAPIVNIPETVVNVPPTDLKPLQKGLEKVEKSVKALMFPTTDLSGVEKRLDKSNKLLKEIVDKPVGGSGGGGSSWPAINEDGIAQPLQVVGGKLVVSSTAPAGGATETKQDVQTALLQQIETNSELLAQLTVVVKSLQQATVDPPYLDKSANAIRNQVQSGTISTVTTLTTANNLGDLNNINAYQGRLLMIGQDISAWALTVRGRIT